MKRKYKAIGTLLIIVILLPLSGCTEYEPIDAENICSYVDKYVTTNVVPKEEIRDENRFEFFIMIMIPCGKSFVPVMVPIYDDYKVYYCEEGIYIAVEKIDTQPTIGKETKICGKVLKDEEDKHLFCIKVDTINGDCSGTAANIKKTI